MLGFRKVFVIESVLISLVLGLFITHDAGIYSVFAASCVGAGGWFFKSNIDEHKVKKEGQNETSPNP